MKRLILCLSFTLFFVLVTITQFHLNLKNSFTALSFIYCGFPLVMAIIWTNRSYRVFKWEQKENNNEKEKRN